MKASELRIGNLLISDIGIVKVESILGSTFRAYCHSIDEEYLADYPINDLQPIPLTEEWLVKAEFEGSIQEGFMKDGFFIAHLTTEDNFEFEFRLPASDGWIIIPVKYVHKLQNLWFELKGEELTFKTESAK